jgi:ABC-type bacteriocin/lantibiotic exporter with double-glycine peptidase domain
MKWPVSSELRWLVRETRPYLRWQVGSLVLVTLGSLLSLLDPLVMKWLIDDLLPHRSIRGLAAAVALIFAAYQGRAVLSSFGGYFNFVASQRLVLSLRLRLLRHIGSLSADYHENTPVGATLYLARDTIQEIAVLGADIFPSALRTLVLAICILTTMSILNVRLTMIIVPLIPLFVVVNRKLRQDLRVNSDSAQAQQTKVSAILQEYVSSMIQSQLLCCEGRQARKAFYNLAHGVRAEFRRRRAEVRYSIFSGTVVVAGMMAILGYGGFQVLSGLMSIGGLVAFYGYLIRLSDPLSTAVEMGSRFQRVGASVRRLMAAFSVEPIVRDAPGATALPGPVRGQIGLRKVSFGFRADHFVVRDLDLEIAPGERIALVGPNGAGKSTTAKLIARLYDAQHGAVLIDRRDVREIALASLRSRLVYTPQHPMLFDCTLEENLRLANPNASLRELNDAADVSELAETIATLPHGWHEPLGPAGSRLSGGQRQRVALARSALQKPRVLVLDEATSSLDASAERRALQRLDLFLPESTLVFITHRLSPITWVDRIVVMCDGRIVETGNHAELYSRRGLYAKLYDHQSAGERRTNGTLRTTDTFGRNDTRNRN